MRFTQVNNPTLLCLALSAFLVGMTGILHAAPGDPGTLDTAFGSSTTFNSALNAVALQPDGRILVAGSFSQVAGQTRLGIARLDTDGSLDTSFDAGLALGTLSCIAVQPDGRILVCGGFLSFNGYQRNSMVRLQADGKVDPSFALPWSPTPYTIQRFLVRDDGRIYVMGGFSSIGGHASPSVLLLHPDGSVDTSFVSSIVFGAVNSIALGPDPGAGPDLYVGGVAFTFPPAANRRFIGKMEASTGSFLPDFNITLDPIPLSGAGYQILPLSGGQVLAAGIQGGSNFTNAYNGMVRLQATGAVDTSFKAGPVPGLFEPGTSAQPFPVIARLPSGKIVAGGQFQTVQGLPRQNIVQLLSNGQVDAGFVPAPGPNNSVNILTVQPDGKILIGGNFQSVDGVPRPFLARLHGDGASPKVLGQPESLTVWEGETAMLSARGGGDPDPTITWLHAGNVVGSGKNLVLSNAAPTDGGSYVARFENTYGTADSVAAVLTVQTSVPQLLSQPKDAAVPIGATAQFTVQATGSRPLHYQWYENGSTLPGQTNPVLNIPVHSQTQYGAVYTVLVSNPRGSTPSGEAILKASIEGAIDAEFSYLAQFEKTSEPTAAYFHLDLRKAKSMVRLPNGDFLIGGGPMTLPSKSFTQGLLSDYFKDISFSSLGITLGTNHLMRLDSDGELAMGDLGTLFLDGPVAKVAAHTDGSAYAVGAFTKIGSLPRRGVLRFLPNGSVDPAFSVSILPTNAVLASAAVDSQGRLLVAGTFTNVGGLPRRTVARILPSGAVDTSFIPSIDYIASGIVFDVAVQADNKVLLASSGTLVEMPPGSRQAPQLARLNADGSWDDSFDTFGGATGNGSDFSVRRILVQPDQRILVAGNFQRFGGGAHTNLARLLPSGGADPAFSSAGECCDAPGNEIRCMALAPNGQIYIGGTFRTPTKPNEHMARLHPDGRYDPSWVPGSGKTGSIQFQEAPEAAVVQPNTRPVFAGNFSPRFLPDVPFASVAGFPPWISAEPVIVGKKDQYLLAQWYGEARHEIEGIVRFLDASVVPGNLVILTQPKSAVVSVGSSNHVLHVTATVPGVTATYSFQWMKGGLVLPGETNSFLILAPLSTAQSGAYSVLVTAYDDYGPSQNVLSQTAKIKVLPAGQLLGNPSLVGSKFQWVIPPLQGLQFSAQDLQDLQVSASINLKDWVPLPNSLQLVNGSLVITDVDAAVYASRFYRIQWGSP